MQYLYGLEVVSIQSYIFATNKLREIIGASEIIERLSDVNFLKKNIGGNFNDENVLRNAAGAVLYLCENLEEAQNAYFKFDMDIKKQAPNLQFCQAIVSISEPSSLGDAKKTLYQKLAANRNVSHSNESLSDMIQLKSSVSGQKGYRMIERGTDSMYVDKSTFKKDEMGTSIIKKPPRFITPQKSSGK